MYKNKNTAALLVGIVLILLISGLTFLRSASKNKRIQEENESVQAERSEMIGSAAKVSGKELSQKISSGGNMMIIDMRDSISFAKEHIPDSKNIPADSMFETLKSLDKEKSYILVDFGPENEMAAMIAGNLKGSGLKNISYLDGGFFRWKKEYYPVVSEGDPNSFVDQSKVSYVRTEDLKKMMESGSELVLIDVRTMDEFRKGHLKGALNIELAQIENRKEEIPVGKKIILYDDTGILAFKAAVKFFDLGIFNAFAFSDGLNAWKEKGYEIAM